mgnify:FL=1
MSKEETKKLGERLEEFYTYFGAVAEDAEANWLRAERGSTGLVEVDPPNASDYRKAIALVKDLEGWVCTAVALLGAEDGNPVAFGSLHLPPRSPSLR